MSFEKLIRIPEDRVGALIGKSGKIKSKIEDTCSVKLDIDSKNGEVQVSSEIVDGQFHSFKALEIITAIGRGFSPEKAMRLLKGENTLHVINLREFGGKSPEQLERFKGRIIGNGGKARINMENLSNSNITVYGKTVSIIGEPTQLKLAINAIESLLSGSMHGHVYKKIEFARATRKICQTTVVGKSRCLLKKLLTKFLLVSFFTAIETLQVLVIQQGHFILQYANSSKILLMRVMEKEF